MASHDQLHRAINAIEAERERLGHAVADTTLHVLREELAALEIQAVRHATLLVVLITKKDTAQLAAAANTATEVLTRHGGIVIKQFRSLSVAMFGPGDSPSDDADAALRAALDVRASLPADVPAAQLLHTQAIPLGFDPHQPDQAGIQSFFEIIRPALEETTPGEIMVTASTAEAVRARVHLAPRGREITPVLFQLVDIAPEVAEPGDPPPEAPEVPMIGRHSELEMLQLIFKQVLQTAQGHSIIVFGMAGVGKSRLLYEHNRWLDEQSQAVWVMQGQATPELGQAPYGLFRQLLDDTFGVRPEISPEAGRRQLVMGITDIMGEDAVANAHLIGHLLGMDFGDSPHLIAVRGDSQLTRRLGFGAVLDLLRAITVHTGMPVVLHLEDLHWADEGSLDLLDYLLGHVQQLPLLIIGVSRPGLFDVRPEWGRTRPGHIVIELRSLSVAQSRQLLRAMLRRLNYISPELENLGVNGASGNPHHMEQLVRLLIEEGVIVPGPNQWLLRTEILNSTTVPDTLFGVVQARLFGLPASERLTLQRAAVVGRVFSDRAVAHLNQESHLELEETQVLLQNLTTRNLIEPYGAVSGDELRAYTFRQEMLYEVAYSSVRQPVVQRYHLQTAQWLIGHSMGRMGDLATRIARHFVLAGEMVRAVKWYGLAAQQAQEQHAPEQAIRAYEKAFMLLPDQNDDMLLQLTLYEGYGTVLESQGLHTDAVSAYTAVCIAAEKLGDLVAQARAWNALARLHLYLDDPYESLEFAQRGAECAIEAGHAGAAELVTAWAVTGGAYIGQGRAEHARQWLLQAVEHGEAHRLDRELAYALAILGLSEAELHSYDSALHWLRRARVLARRSGAIRSESLALGYLSEIARRRGEYALAIEHLQAALALARQRNDRRDVLVQTNNLGAVLVTVGRHAEGLRYLERVVDMVGADGWWGAVGTYRYLAEGYIALGAADKAQHAANAALRHAYRHDYVADHGVAWRAAAIVASRLDEPLVVEDEAITPPQAFSRSADALMEGGLHRELAETLWCWANYERDHGDPARHAELWQQAYRLVEGLDAPRLLEQLRADSPFT